MNKITDLTKFNFDYIKDYSTFNALANTKKLELLNQAKFQILSEYKAHKLDESNETFRESVLIQAIYLTSDYGDSGVNNLLVNGAKNASVNGINVSFRKNEQTNLCFDCVKNLEPLKTCFYGIVE